MAKRDTTKIKFSIETVDAEFDVDIGPTSSLPREQKFSNNISVLALKHYESLENNHSIIEQ